MKAYLPLLGKGVLVTSTSYIAHWFNHSTWSGAIYPVLVRHSQRHATIELLIDARYPCGVPGEAKCLSTIGISEKSHPPGVVVLIPVHYDVNPSSPKCTVRWANMFFAGPLILLATVSRSS
jgi:hypothetical protein